MMVLKGETFPNLVRKLRSRAIIDCVRVHSSKQKSFSIPVTVIFTQRAPLTATNETKCPQPETNELGKFLLLYVDPIFQSFPPLKGTNFVKVAK